MIDKAAIRVPLATKEDVESIVQNPGLGKNVYLQI